MSRKSYPLYYEIGDFTGGWDNVSKPTTLNKRSFTDLKNWNITRHKGLEKRGGMDKLYSTTSTASTDVTSLYEYKAPNGNNYVLTAVSTLMRAYYNAKWNSLKTGLTAGKKYSFVTHRGLCYMGNGQDDNFKLHNTTSYACGITPPESQPVVQAITPDTEEPTSTHATANADTVGKLRSTTSETLLSQSFKLPLGVDLSKVVLKMRKVGTPSGHTHGLWAEIHTSQEGTSATKNGSTNIVTASSASSNVNPATGLTTAFADTTFTFTTAPECDADTTYYLMVYGDFTVSTINYVEVGFDNDSPSYEDGMYFKLDASLDWTEVQPIDLVFEVYGAATTSTSQEKYGDIDTGVSESIYYDYAQKALAQSFQVDSAIDVYKVLLPLEREYWDEWGNEVCWVEIHSSTDDTSFAKGESDNIVGEASANETIELLGGGMSLASFPFEGTKPSLTANTTYYLVLFTNAEESTTYTLNWTYDDTGYSEIGAVTATCTGLDDATSGGTSTTSSDLSYRVQVDSTGGTDTFKWSDNGGTTWDETEVDMTGSAQTLNNGVTITFDATTGHTSGDYWDFDVTGNGYYIGATGTWHGTSSDFSFDIWGAPTAASAQESYALTNLKEYKGLRETSATQMIAQSFITTVGADCTKIILYLSRVGTIAGGKTIWLEVHDGQDGISNSQDTSTRLNGTYATASKTPDAISTNSIYDAITFTFNTTDPTLIEGNTYYFVLYGDYDVSTTKYLKVQMDNLSPAYANGSRWDIDDEENDGESWTERPASDLTFIVYQVPGGQTGNYKYCYTYKRTAFQEMESNPSDPSTVTDFQAKSGRITLVASTDAQVGSIVLYRTKAGGDTFLKVAETTNAAQDYDEDLDDGELTTELELNNGVPPKAKYLLLHKDRIFYMNCPDEDNGESLVMWSKSGNGEAVPTLNYQYFDKDDGEGITGCASLGDYLLVFKRNKIGILAGSLNVLSGTSVVDAELWYLSYGIGCISGYAILPFKDKIVFLSEEGWKATDGRNIWTLSTAVNGLIEDGYFVAAEEDNYSAAYYPDKEQFQFLSHHDSLTQRIFVGHFLIPLLLEAQGASELEMGEIVGWSYHQYDNDELTCLGTYTDSSGITKVIAGAADGFVYELDSGNDDDGANIETNLQSDWLPLGATSGETITLRRGFVAWTATASATMTFVVDIDFAGTNDDTDITNDSTGTADGATSSMHLKGTGRLFRFTLNESSAVGLSLSKIALYYRSEGVR